MEKKFKVNFAKYSAIEEIIDSSGRKRELQYKIFVDNKGLKIITKNGIEYLSEYNSEIV